MVLEQLAQERVKTLIYHDSFPGLGYIVPNELTWDFKRVNYEKTQAVQTMCPAI